MVESQSHHQLPLSIRSSEGSTRQELYAQSTGILICDVWDQHWCRGASNRIHELARRIERVTTVARAAGIQIIHSPSDTMHFYRHYPERRRMQEIVRIVPPVPLPHCTLVPPPPLDISDDGCDTKGDVFRAVWTRENLAITIEPEDVISDSGQEIISFLKYRGINTLLYVGVHANICILNRSFCIANMSDYGVSCILIRDLVDVMYNPEMPPCVSREEALELTVRYIEQYCCPSTSSDDLLTLLEG